MLAINHWRWHNAVLHLSYAILTTRPATSCADPRLPPPLACEYALSSCGAMWWLRQYLAAEKV